MWGKRKRIRERVTVGKRVRRIKVSAEKNKTLTTIVILWLVTQFAGSMAKGLPELNPWLVARYQWVLSLNSNSSGTLPQLLNFNLLFWPLAGCALMIRGIIQYFVKKRRETVEIEEPFTLYKEELAAAVEAIDSGLNASEQILALLLLIAETVAVNVGLRKKEYRMYFVVPKPQDPRVTSEVNEKKGLLSGIRIGRQFELVGTSITPTDFRKITDMDSMNVETFLGVDVTEVTTLANMETQGAHALLFIRNPGKRLRLGLYVAVLKETNDEDLTTYEDMFYRVSHIVATLGFIDAISQFVVNYQREGSD